MTDKAQSIPPYPPSLTRLGKEIESLHRQIGVALLALDEADLWTDSGGECAIHIEAARDALLAAQNGRDES